MSTQVLARKYRPRSFTDGLVGQEHVVQALTHALESQRLHHAYLFTGTRGVGKTTLSRILAKSLNCRGTDGQGGVTAYPCGVCGACTAIDAGRFVDYIEMDAASNRSVEDMSALLDRAVYAPTAGRYKVYMIDEVHMLTNTAFNSMLKTLEEPPEHVKFILATTDPQKIPVTILSRCLQFNLKQMSPTATAQHLAHVLKIEGLQAQDSALKLIARAAKGSMRDALSLTDQAIAFCSGNISEPAVREMLGAVDTGYLVEILEALAARNGKQLLEVADRMSTRAIGFETALADLAALSYRIALAQTIAETVHEEIADAQAINRLARLLAPEDIQLFYSIAVKGAQEIAWAPDPGTGFAMTLLRMLAFLPDHEIAVADSKPLLNPAANTAARLTVPLKPSFSPPTTPENRAGQEKTSFQTIEDWPTLAAKLPITGFARQLATQSLLVSDDGALLTLSVSIKNLAEQVNINKLASALKKMGIERKIQVQVDSTTEHSVQKMGKTAYQIEQDKRIVEQEMLEQTVLKDPFVQQLVQEFDAVILPGSIKPLLGDSK